MGFRYWLALILVLTLAPKSQAAVHLGITGGINNTSLKGDAPDKVKLASLTGPMLGVVAEFDIAKDVRLSIQPMFVRKGSKLLFEVPDQEERADSLRVELDYISVPLLAKILAGNERTYVTGGLDFAFLANATLTGRGEGEDVADIFKNFDLSAIFGFGVNFPVGKPTINVEFRYTQSILNIADVEESNLGLPVRIRSSGFQLLAGAMIRLGDE